MTRESRASYRARTARAERDIDAAVATVRAEVNELHKARKAAAEERERLRHKYTRAEVEDATFIHDGHTWRQVVRVNGKSVTVTTGYSWTDRVPFDRIHNVTRIEKPFG